MAVYRNPESDQDEQPAQPDGPDPVPESSDNEAAQAAARKQTQPLQEFPDEEFPNEEEPHAQGEHHKHATRPLHPLLGESGTSTDAPQPWPDDDGGEATSGPAPDDDTDTLNPEHAYQARPERLVQGLAAAAQRDVGRMRQNNQDSVFSLLTTLPREESDVPLGLFVVADGMGGHEGGEIASRLAIHTVAREVLAQLVLPALQDGTIEALQPVMISAVQEANYAIWQHAQGIGSDMGTTCTAALLLGQALYIAHVGDSRAYLRDADGLRPLTSDHSTVGRLIELGQLAPEQAREHPLRNQLYRTIGQNAEVDVEFVYEPLGSSTHLLLCSDGLWGMLSEAQMEQVLTHCAWPQEACAELIDFANLAGGEDNIAAVVVTLPVVERSYS
jgi:serine/threonine protein phosphatase PrpC